MKRRSFAKKLALASLAITVTPLLSFADNKKSTFLKLALHKQSPQFDYFAIDSLGKDQLNENVILHDDQWVKDARASWKLTETDRSFTLRSEYSHTTQQPFLINIEQHLNHATLLGMMSDNENDMISLPAVLHLPDRGSLRITCTTPHAKIKCTAMRFIEHPYVRMEFPGAGAGEKSRQYHFEVVAIHPELPGLNDEKYDCYRRNFISIFQLNPFLKILANNTASDACAFTLYKYAMVASHTPALAKGLHANDLIQMTLDRYLAGKKGYGLLGYDYDKEWVIPESSTSCHSLDSYPSLLLAASIYVKSSNNKTWFKKNLPGLKLWADKIVSMDEDDDGLIEYCLSGNSGSWKGDKTQRPANWWDTIGFGHKDAYSNALAYQALTKFAEVSMLYGNKEIGLVYVDKTRKLKSSYVTTFLNPSTGILAGWKSADGKLHDYYFVFVNAVAIYFGLVEDKLANTIMDNLLQKMKGVGYTNFELGLPGNLIPVIRADYTDLLLEVGGGKREDNLDGFQIYENGGATACFTYFTIAALQKLNRKKDADTILLPLLTSMSAGNFQGRCDNGRSRDWKTWTGECWGYEGFLVDNYLFLLAAN